VFIAYQKIRRHTKKSRRKAQKKLLQFTRRNVKQLENALHKVRVSRFDKEAKKKFLKKVKPFYRTAKKLIEQQHNIYKGKRVKNRIVSLWAIHVRPMVRGKFPIEVEFGPKTLVNMKNGFLFLQSYSFNNINDGLLLEPSIQNYKQTFGHTLTELGADRGFYSRENVIKDRELGVKNVAIQRKGEIISPSKDPPFVRRLRKARCAIEAKISLAKRSFGWNRINYQIPNGEEIWLRLSLLAMNYHLALDYR
jgi:hypothetical protein